MTHSSAGIATLEMEMASDALVALTEHGIPADVQELLVYGNPSFGIAPGAFSKAVKAILRRASLQPATPVEAATPRAYRLDHPTHGIELSIRQPDNDWAKRGWTVTPLYAGVAKPKLDLGAEHPDNYRLAFSKQWTVEQFWQFAEGLTDAHVRDQLRDTMAKRGLSLSSTQSEAGK